MTVALLFVPMLAFMLMRVFLPVGARKSGKTVKTVTLTLVERFLWQRMNLYAIAAFVLVALVSGAIETGAMILMLFAAQAVLAIPVRCVLTSDGIAINNVLFRPWREFSGFSVESRRLVVRGQEGTRPLNVPLLAEHQKEVLPALRRYLPEIRARKEAPGAKRAAIC